MSKKILAAVGLAAMVTGGPAHAVISLFDYGFNIDGDVDFPTLGDPVPSEANVAGFDTTTGLGNVSVSISGAGSHNVGMFFDHEIDEAVNTFFNEVGNTSGSPPTGLSWEIDEPGFVFGDIFSNFQNNTLDNTNALPPGGPDSPDDVSMAQMWNFTLLAGEMATASFLVAEQQPTGFFLSHTDPDSDKTIYYSSELRIQGEAEVPEPTTLALIGIGLAGVGLGRRRTRLPDA